MEMEDIKQYADNKKIKWSTHCLERMQERDISRKDVKNCILNGEIIEDYPTDFPHPSCLIFGQTIESEVLHVVVGCDGEYIFIITTYYPNTDKFQEDLKTRRRK